MSIFSLNFKPPLACEFQTSSYMLTISDGNKTWTNTRDPVAIINTSKPVEVEMESGFLMDTDYLVTITVFTEYANISSNRTFSESIIHMVLIPFTFINVSISQGLKFLLQRTNQIPQLPMNVVSQVYHLHWWVGL